MKISIAKFYESKNVLIPFWIFIMKPFLHNGLSCEK